MVIFHLFLSHSHGLCGSYWPKPPLATWFQRTHLVIKGLQVSKWPLLYLGARQCAKALHKHISLPIATGEVGTVNSLFYRQASILKLEDLRKPKNPQLSSGGDRTWTQAGPRAWDPNLCLENLFPSILLLSHRCHTVEGVSCARSGLIFSTHLWGPGELWVPFLLQAWSLVVRRPWKLIVSEVVYSRSKEGWFLIGLRDCFQMHCCCIAGL